MAGKDPLKAVRKNLKRANKAMGKERKRQQKVRDQRSAAHPSDEGLFGRCSRHRSAWRANTTYP
jgi:hypothetical protein